MTSRRQRYLATISPMMASTITEPMNNGHAASNLRSISAGPGQKKTVKFPNAEKAKLFFDQLVNLRKQGLKAQWDGNNKVMLEYSDPEHLRAAIGIMKQMKGAMIPGGAGASITASNLPQTKNVDFSFADDLDRELFVTELEFAFRGQGPSRVNTWNASCTVPIKTTEQLTRVKKIAQKYFGVQMSLSKANFACAAVDDVTLLFSSPQLAAVCAKKLKSLTPAVDVEGAEVTVSGVPSVKVLKVAKTVDRAVKLVSNATMSASNPSAPIASAALAQPAVAAPAEPATTSEQPQCDFSMSFPDANSAQRFAMSLMRMGNAKVSLDGTTIKASFPHDASKRALSMAMSATSGSGQQSGAPAGVAASGQRSAVAAGQTLKAADTAPSNQTTRKKWVVSKLKDAKAFLSAWKKAGGFGSVLPTGNVGVVLEDAVKNSSSDESTLKSLVKTHNGVLTAQ